MKTYLDANALVRLYLQLSGWEELRGWMTSQQGRRGWPSPLTDLLRMEATNAIHRMVYESRTGGQWRITPESAAIGLAELAEHLAEGSMLQRAPLALTAVESQFDLLSARYTARHGFRTYDLLHVASAVTLGCTRFLSFDAKANALAKLAGLETA